MKQVSSVLAERFDLGPVAKRYGITLGLTRLVLEYRVTLAFPPFHFS